MTASRLTFILAMIAASVATVALTPGAARAATYSGMENCPLSAPAMKDPSNLQVGCVYSVTHGGSVTIGSTTVALNNPITLQFGVYWPASAPTRTFPDGSEANVYSTVPAAGGRTLVAKPLQVAIPGIANIIPGVTSVFAQVELAGPITGFVPLATGEDTPVFVMPIKLHLYNALFGARCYIGSDTDPIRFSPTTGTTSPPAPNKPATGDAGTISIDPDPNGFQTLGVGFTGATLVDNAYAVPKASGCGLIPGSLDPLIDLAFGPLPSAAGRNAVVFSGNDTSFAVSPSLDDLTRALAAS
ncbi:hypothetical protein ACWT_5594 [Actinoplanes sp. SE50]|uniref:hypothetical protein n=1 Tax=unclassified Actinoplanes TaxID=2626549 RepID=UPI00023ECF19|nr:MULTISPECIES: hypothetical protein [unclassified Actinoplanes]AEV86611.1 hypothetical protein ACPL_5724 [Actinoplanes sp. SE50/110]ATO85009.1 hypothetical protein ACWT_5594 [Actinoplanes sp. SE50]SLM02418.1 hypothetical protein ACSP50_5667 [Actinoplanes sp. SE50/110]